MLTTYNKTEANEPASDEQTPLLTGQPSGHKRYFNFENLEEFAGRGIDAPNVEILQSLFIDTSFFDDSMLLNITERSSKKTGYREKCNCLIGTLVGRITKGDMLLFDASQLEGQVCKKNTLCVPVSTRSNPRPA